ncbi:MAG: aminopeptidase, partial [Methanomicrobia archaeon]|nr:aminopeptidase [Methanomicrobia archaeon]
VYADLDQPEFVKMVVEACYRLGARSVKVEWNYQPLGKIHVKYQSLKTLSSIDDWQIERLKHYVKTIPARIYILSEDPDGNKGINQLKLSKANQATYPITKPFRDQLENKYQWTIVGVPSKPWAKKVFPTLPVSQAVEKLWDAIFYTARVTEDPIKAWQDHNADIQKRCDYLNSLGLVTLHYQAKNGTDFKVGMLDNALWIGGGETSLQGIFYNPNMPTEEVFVTPKKGVAEGVVYSTKPLSYRGELIDNFSIRFENGKAVEVHAEKNEALLKQMIAMDEGAAYLGECALVPFDSPIRNSGITFWNTLYDENAACHLALGMGFSNCIKDYEKYTKADFDKMGVNDSMIHVDFMIGSEDLSITGIDATGKRIPIFAHGNWAF